MIWGILLQREQVVHMPRSLTADSMFTFVENVIDEQRDVKSSKIIFDYANLEFIEPVGVVILSNLIEYLKRCGAKTSFRHHTRRTDATKFLDDSGFFARYTKQQLFAGSHARATTVPLNFIRRDETQTYLLHQLMPWIGGSVGLTANSLASVKVSLEEVLHNVSDHSGVDFGCSFAQHFPNKKRIQIAISDFGRGIPELVRTVRPGVSDSHALRLACEEGFTTKSNVQNRGAGLPTLMRFVTKGNGGNVLLVSGTASLTASTTEAGKFKITARNARGCYPGTLVRVILRTDTLERAVEDAELEPFKW